MRNFLSWIRSLFARKRNQKYVLPKKGEVIRRQQPLSARERRISSPLER